MLFPSIKSIVYFTVIVLLLYLYILMIRLIGRHILYLFKVNKKRREYNKRRTKNPEVERPKLFLFSDYKENVLDHPFWMRTKEHRLYWSLFIIGNLFFWHYFRDKWVINSEYKHKEAREYYALGHLMLSYEMGMLKFLGDPGSVIMLPVDTVQKWMIDEAKALLPENDGEIEIFRFHMLLYPYASREYRPNDSKSLEIATLTYDILEGLSTKTIADPHVREYDRYRFHTLTAYYYSLAHLFRYDPVVVKQGPDLMRAFFKDQAEYDRLQQIVSWLIDAHEKWQHYPKINTFMDENPDFSVIHYAMISLFLDEMTWYEIMNLEYRCDSETVALAQNYFHYFKAHYQHLYRQKSDRYYSRFENLVIDKSVNSDKFAHYLCGYPRLTQIPGIVHLEPNDIERTRKKGYDGTFPFTERYLELDQIIKHGKEIYEGKRELQPCEGVRCHSREELMKIIETEYTRGRYQ